MIINNKNTNIYKKIDLLLWFMWGFSCLIFVPYIDLFSISIQLVEVCNLLVFASIFLKISLDKRWNNSKCVNISLIIILVLYALAIFWPIGGVITVYHLGYIPRLSTFLVPFARLFIIVTLFLAYIYFDTKGWQVRVRALLKGFIAGCIVTVMWMIVEHIMFTIFRIPINKLIFEDILNMDVKHTFINIIGGGFLGIPFDLYRATGFSWDPGMVTPLIVLGWLTYNLLSDIFIGKHRLWVSCVLLLSLPLSLSRTAILGTVIVSIIIFISEFLGCFLGNISQINVKNKLTCKYYYTVMHIKSILFAIILTIVLLFILFACNNLSISMFFKGIFNFINDIFTDQSPGTQRHLTYFKLIPKALFLNLPAFLLGYGAANVGVSMEIVGIGILPDIENLISVWKGKWNPESMTVTFALMGGIVTLLAFTICIGICLVTTFIRYLKRPWNKQYLSYFIILLAPFVLGMGYGIDNHIVFIMIFLMIVHICTNHS